MSFLAVHGLKSAGGIFEEVIIEPGMRVTIAGLMMKDLAAVPPEGEAGYREDAPRVFGWRETSHIRSSSARPISRTHEAVIASPRWSYVRSP